MSQEWHEAYVGDCEYGAVYELVPVVRSPFGFALQVVAGPKHARILKEHTLCPYIKGDIVDLIYILMLNFLINGGTP